MVDFNVPLPSAPTTASPVEYLQTGQEFRLRNAQLLAYQEQARQRHLENEKLAATQTLAKAAIAGDPNSLAQLSVVAPDMAKGVRDYNNYKITRSGQLWQGVTTAPKPVRGKLYQQAIKQYENEFGETPNVPAEYSPEADDYLKGLINQSRDVEKVSAQEFERPLQEQKVVSELVSQQKTKADIAKTYQDIAKSKEDLEVSRQERAAAASFGMSPAAYKTTQQQLGETQAKRIADLPRIEDQAQKSISLINDIVNHPGMSSVVGFKNPLGGALPFIGNVAGTKAADFQAKLDQLQGQQFLEAYETLKGGGQITEVEGEKATNAIASMQTSQSEKQFKQSAKELKEVINRGLERARRGIVVNRSSNTTPIRNQSGGGGEDPLGIR